MQLNIPQPILEITQTLQMAGFEVFFVGGCVRDAYMGRVVHDFDATTNATPTQMKEVLASYKIIETGIKHGTLTIIHQHQRLEITTYRTQEVYENHRSPNSIHYTNNLSDDLSRRDFTMNALAYHVCAGIVDEYNGRKDIDAKIIRCIGNPHIRFQEDALRILRGVRFAHRFGFQIEANTKQAMIDCVHLLEYVSMERCRDELFEMLSGTCHNVLKRLDEIHALDRFSLTYDAQLDERLNQSYENLSIRLALLLENSKTFQILKQWKCPNQLIKQVLQIQKALPNSYTTRLELRYLLWENHNDFECVRLILLAKQIKPTLLDTMLQEQDYLTHLAINGNDCIQLGYQGQAIKKALEKCIHFVLEDLSRNQKKLLLDYLRQQ